MILAIAYIIFPLRINSTVSKLNVENVLKPPQKPVMIKNFQVEEISVLLIKNVIVTASIIQLNALETNVAKGKMVLNRIVIKIEIPYLTRLPSPPPINIAKILFMCKKITATLQKTNVG